jgi:hypothetical protein
MIGLGNIIDRARDNVAAIIGGIMAVAIVGLVVALMLTRATLDTRTAERELERAAHAETLAGIRLATERALTADRAQAERVRAAQDAITKETTDALETRLAAARADADRYRLRAAPACRGGGERADLSPVADAAGTTDGPGDTTLVDDARICAANTVKAEAWREWWMQVSEIER